MRLWGRKSKSSGWGDADRTYVQRHLDFGSVRPTDWDEDPEPPKRSWFSRSNRAAQDEHEYYDHADGPQCQQSYEGAWDNESQPVDQHHRGGPDDRTRYDNARQKFVSFRNLIKCAAVGTVVTGLWLGSTLFYYTLKFPDPQSMGSSKQTPVLRILARDGSLLAERGGSHPYMPLQLLPKHVIDAVIAIEDRNFFNHWGVDPVGLTRAALVNMRVGRFVQGGSTITQQLAKNLFLSSERTMTRKLDELTLALWLETRLSKSDIIELYLNRVYFGSGSYGIESATQRYFGKSARALTVSEAAIIAGLLKAPSRLSPVSNPGLARKRGRLVLSRMLDIGVLSADAYTTAKNQPIRFHRSKPKRTITGTEYAVDFILDEMPNFIDAGYGDVVVETTLDAKLQKQAGATLRKLIQKRGKELNAKQGAIVVMDVNGGVRALVGGYDYAKSQFNRAVKAKRQPGSTFKPFVYLTALESGLRPTTTTYDLPISIEGWSPKNANGKYTGAITLRNALARSVNTVAVRLALDAGPERVARTATRLGIKSKLKPEPSLALGTSEVSLIGLTQAYNTFAAGGQETAVHVIRRIRSSGGRVLYAHAELPGQRIVAEPHVGAINDMLNAALVNGTGRRAGIPKHPAAGKTGTSQKFRDAWFIGYTAHMTAGVWIGNDRGRPMKKVSGGGLPAQIWRDVMVNAHKDLQPVPLPGTSWQASRIAKAKTTSKDQPVWQATNAPSPLAAQPRKNRRTKPAKRIDPPQQRPRQRIVIKAPSKISPRGRSDTPQTRSKPPVSRSAAKRVAKIAPSQQPPKTPPLPDVKPNVWSLALGRMLEQGTLPLASKERGPRSFEAISDTIRVGQSSTSQKSKRKRGATRATTPRKPKSRLPVANRMALGRRLTQAERAALQNPPVSHEFNSNSVRVFENPKHPNGSIPVEFFLQAQGHGSLGMVTSGSAVEPSRPELMYPAPAQPSTPKRSSSGFDPDDIRRRLIQTQPR